MTGLTAANALQSQGWKVRVVDKGRNPGGRMSTRRKGNVVFDHGAQFFTVRDAAFRKQVDRWLSGGKVRHWFGEPGRERYCSTDGMNGLAASMAQGLDLQLGCTVKELSSANGRWTARVAENEEVISADALILTAPVPQSWALTGPLLTSEIQTELARISYDPCLALMVTLDGPSTVPDPGYLRLEEGCVAVISDNTKKGIAGCPAAVTLHSSAPFAREHWDSPHEIPATQMLQAAKDFLGTATQVSWQLHRWRYSQPVETHPSPCLGTEVAGASLVFAGDAFGGPRIEGAYISGLAAAQWVTTKNSAFAD
jgi:renalase